MLFSKASIEKAIDFWEGLNGHKQVIAAFTLLAAPILKLFNDWVNTASGVAGLILLIWVIIRQYPKWMISREDLKIKRIEREMKEQEQHEYWLERRNRIAASKKLPPTDNGTLD